MLRQERPLTDDNIMDTPNGLNMTPQQYLDVLETLSPALKQSLYEQAYESTTSVLYRYGLPTSPAALLSITDACSKACLASLVLREFIALEDKGKVPADELAAKRAAKANEQPTLPFDSGSASSFQHMPDPYEKARAAGGYL